jgi:hypothetical protein
MSLEIKFSFSTIEAAMAFLAMTGQEPAKAEVQAPKPVKTEKPAAPTAPVATPPTAEAAPAVAPATPVSYEKSGIPEKIAAAVSPTGGKRAEVIALLAKFGAKKGGELKPADFAKFSQEIDALMMA